MFANLFPFFFANFIKYKIIISHSVYRLLNLQVGEKLNLLTQTVDWPDKRRVAIVNSFGFGATNASLVVGEI